MSDEAIEVELARHQWDEGARAVRRLDAGSAAEARRARQMEVVIAELSRRIGQVFTLRELAELYADADRWSLTLIHEELPEDPVSGVASAVDAAFGLYARRASDFRL
jgi:hypothetical protein